MRELRNARGGVTQRKEQSRKWKMRGDGKSRLQVLLYHFSGAFAACVLLPNLSPGSPVHALTV